MSPFSFTLRFFGLVFEASLGPDEEAEGEDDGKGAALGAAIDRTADGPDPAFGFGRHWGEEEQ